MRRLLKNVSILIIGIFLTTTIALAEDTRILAFGSNLNFGSVNIGESVTKELTLYNRGNSPLTIEKLRFHEKIADVYSGNYAGVILAGGEQNVTISFTPESEEDYAGLVYIESDRTNGGDRDRLLKGSGKNSETKILEFGNNLNFGSVNIGESVTKELTLYNRGNSPLTIEKIRFHEKIADVYSGNYAGVILAGGEQNVTITFTPELEEDYAGLVYIESDRTNGGDRDRLLEGRGLAETQEEQIERFASVLNSKCRWSLDHFNASYNREGGILLGDITCHEITQYELKSFKVLKSLDGSLNLSNNNLVTLAGLNSLSSVKGRLDLSNNKLINVDGLSQLGSVGTFFDYYSDLYNNPKLASWRSEGSLFLNNNQLTNVDGLLSLHSVERNFFLDDNNLTNLSGLSKLTSVGSSHYTYLDTSSIYYDEFSDSCRHWLSTLFSYSRWIYIVDYYTNYNSFVASGCYSRSVDIPEYEGWDFELGPYDDYAGYRNLYYGAYSSQVWSKYLSNSTKYTFKINNNPNLVDISGISNVNANDASSLYIDSHGYDVKADKESTLCKTYWRINGLDYDQRESICNY